MQPTGPALRLFIFMFTRWLRVSTGAAKKHKNNPPCGDRSHESLPMTAGLTNRTLMARAGV
jgi:hypothetical protein